MGKFSETIISIMWASVLCKGRATTHHRYSQLRPMHEIVKDEYYYTEDSDDDCPYLKTRAVKEPPGMWYYISNHILINRERAYLHIHALFRNRELDQLARVHASNMAKKRCKKKYIYVETGLVFKAAPKPCRR